MLSLLGDTRNSVEKASPAEPLLRVSGLEGLNNNKTCKHVLVATVLWKRYLMCAHPQIEMKSNHSFAELADVALCMNN